jgi:hypothetical protein
LEKLDALYSFKIINKHHDIVKIDNEASLTFLKQKQYWLSLRSNGNPYFLYFTKFNGINQVLFIDKKNGLEIRGHHSTSEVHSGGEYVSSVADAVSFAQKHNFPETGVVLKYRKSGMFKVYKNISTIEDLMCRVEKMLSYPFVRKIFIETDMRAHKNPLRMNAIEQATKDLLKNINSLCPQCGAPGFVVSDVQPGLACDSCSLPTDLPLSEIYTCAVCSYSQSNIVVTQKTTMTSVFCKHCNP